MVEITVFLLMVIPGIVLALRGSSFLIDYTILIFVFNREIRRIVDFYNQEFNALSTISVTPLVMLGLLFVSFIGRFNVFHPKARQIFVLLLAAISYGFVIGITRNGFACIFQGVQYLSTIGMMGYVATSLADDKTADRWLRTAALAGVLAAAYGWYQYLTIPDWDAFWVKEVNFIGYLGQLAPTKMSVFSTFADRGICSVYMALVSISILVSRRWRVAFGWPEVALLLSCVFLTNARTGLIVALLGTVLFPILNAGKHAVRIVLIVSVVVGVFFAFSSSIPGADRLIKRFETLLHIGDDSSFQGRIAIAQWQWNIALEHPLGFGIGSSGMADRLNGNAVSVVSDNGWIEIMASLGLPGFLLFVAALILIWRYFSMLGHLGIQDDYLGLARTFFVVALIGTWTGNLFVDFSVMWIAIGRALSPTMLRNVVLELDEAAEDEPETAAASGIR